MMVVYFHKHFRKQLEKFSRKDRNIIEERIAIFLDDPFHPMPRNHALRGKFFGYRSIDIRPDIRAIYKVEAKDTALFITIGTHGQLYR